MSDTRILIITAFLDLVVAEDVVHDQWLSLDAWRALLYRRFSFKNTFEFIAVDLGNAIQTLMTWDKDKGRKGISIFYSIKKSCIIDRDDTGKAIKEHKRFVYVTTSKKSTKRTESAPYIPSTTRELLPIFTESKAIVGDDDSTSNILANTKTFRQRVSHTNQCLNGEVDGFLEKK